MDSPFNLTDDAAYQRWRDQKLAGYPSTAEELIVEVENPEQLSSHEYEHLLGLCKKTNMAIYSSRWELQDKKDMLNIARQFGLNRLDKHLCADDIGVSALRDDPVAQRHEYIPYTNRAINWHTDGYYNTPGHQIRAMMLHCASAAESGGSNQVFDHELLYIHLREQNPAFIKALMQPEVMTIPANVQGGKEIRPALTGPVFSI